MRGKGNRRERRDSNCCEMKGEGGEERGGWKVEGRGEGRGGNRMVQCMCSVCEHYQMSW